ncbi:MAG: response regulator [Candidatus Cloacimonetes bacterium]|nr:response regulator [Candidatus Cloacimonadota bacterium]
MNARILLVDDDRLLREVIGDFLRSRGHEVDIASNRAEAVEFLQQGKYRLALIDHDSRQRGGIKLMREIRQADPQVFCLIMTGYSSLKTVAAAMEEGATDYILKPFQLEELTNLLGKYL